MKIPADTYCVGGALRDELLGLEVRDRDWVVVGATAEEMLANGFKPVGRDFPVFIHPHSGEEYALARTERKTRPGYSGFVFHADPDVSLEEDLRRRDLTINAMARGRDGVLIDPYNGRDDLENKLLRHISPAFAEDPVRILRVARFAARFANFSVAEETLALMQDMVAQGEVDALVPERVWQELASGLMEDQPARMIEILRACGALKILLPELDCLWGIPQRPQQHPEIDCGKHSMMALNMAARMGASLPVRFATLLHDLGKGSTPQHQLPSHSGHEARSEEMVLAICQRLRVPVECRDLARLVARFHGEILRIDELDAAARLELLQRCDALRRPQRFVEILQACEADYRGRQGFANSNYPHASKWLDCLKALQGIDEAAIAKTCANAGEIVSAVRQSRLQAISHLMRVAPDGRP